MNLKEVKDTLIHCVREELHDPSFGDSEVYWILDGKEVASGYFGTSIEQVSGEGWQFTGKDARSLRELGIPGRVERNS